MARQTNTRLREKVIYSVFVRNHTKEGTFQALEGDLDRLAALGTDIIWLMPIHPIGEAATFYHYVKVRNSFIVRSYKYCISTC